MKVTSKLMGNAAVAAIDGRVDSTNAKNLNEELSTIIDSGPSRLVIDCAKLDYISSAGMRALLLAIKKTNAAGGGMAMSQVSDHIREILEVSGFTRLTTVHDTTEEAVASLS